MSPRFKRHENIRRLKEMLLDQYDQLSPKTQQRIERGRGFGQRLYSGIKFRSPAGRAIVRRKLVGEAQSSRELLVREFIRDPALNRRRRVVK